MTEQNKSFGSTKNPKISVIIPLYNHADYIREAVDSVLNQSFDNFELIIINDGSTDSSEEVIKNINDDRIKYYYQENQGTHNALNRGINLARGEYISILNSDDVYAQKRFGEMTDILEHDSSVHAAFSFIDFIDLNSKLIRLKRGAEDNWLGQNPETSYKENNNIILDLLAGNFLYTTSNLFCRKFVFDHIGYFSHLKYIHDYEFFLRLCYHYKVHIIKEPLLKYRFHEANALKEDFSQANFETAIVLSNFLIKYDLDKFISNDDEPFTALTKFFNSLNTYDTDKMIMTLLLFGLKYRKETGDNFIEMFSGNGNNPFKTACIAKFKKNRDITLLKQSLSWQEGQTELWWRKAEELKARLYEEIKRRDDQLVHAGYSQYTVTDSYKWKLLLKFSDTIEKFLPLKSKRRFWMKIFLQKTFFKK